MARVGIRVLLMAVVCQTLALAAVVYAQDVFELAVFPYETVEPGRTNLELHSNLVPVGASSGPSPAGPSHYPFHLSVEVAHGWTRYFETGVFLEAAPLASGGAEKFAGGHVRAQWRLPESARLPFHIGISTEYSFNRLQFDTERQTIGVRAILERHAGRLYIALNPDLELVVKGPAAESGHSSALAAKVEWDVTRTVSTGAEYYSSGPLKHFDMATPHHFLIPTIDLHASPAWEINLGAGHCLSDIHEPWIFKVIVGHRFEP